MGQERVLGWGSIWARVAVAFALLALPRVAFAETKTYCDNKCGDTQQCQIICCHITTGGPYGTITNINCSSSVCCAHPEGSAIGGGGIVKIPSNFNEAVSGRVRWAIVDSQVVDASKMNIETDTKAKTLSLTGTVSSPEQRAMATTIAKRHATGYKIVNHLTVAQKRE